MTTHLILDTVIRADGTRAVVATGEIDLSNVESFSSAVQSAVAHHAEGGPRIEVDLSAVEYLDSGGISVLYAHADRIRVVANRLLMPVLEVSGLAELTPVEAAGG